MLEVLHLKWVPHLGWFDCQGPPALILGELLSCTGLSGEEEQGEGAAFRNSEV